MSNLSQDEIKQLLSLSKSFLAQHQELFSKEVPYLPQNESSKKVIKEKSEQLQKFYEEIKNCMACKLGKTRNHLVFGDGFPDANLMIIGEGPGADEDETGHPFVGRAGQLLTSILKAINFSRKDVFIANIVKCRPPENRRPEPDEVAKCTPYLDRQIEIIQPKIILALGATAGNTLLKNQDALGDMRGKWHDYKGIPVMVTYHPAALLRNPNFKIPTWQDVQLLRKTYDQMVG